MAGPAVGIIRLGFGRAHIPAFQASGWIDVPQLTA